jgi:hypothetical protein
MKQCNVCKKAFDNAVYSSHHDISITSLFQTLPGRTTVYFCANCTHIQTVELKNIDNFYDKEYKLLVASDEEDQIYCIRDGEKVFRYDHQVETLVKLLDIPEGARVLDYGCAKATTLKKLIERSSDIAPYL